MAHLNGAPATPDDMEALALVNYGHFTSMRVEDGRVRGFSLHLDRLVRDCRTLFAADLDRDQARRYIRDAVRGRGGTFAVRVTVFDPALDLGRPASSGQPSILVTTRAIAERPLPALRVGSAAYVRDLPEVKHVGLLGPLWHRRAAQRHGLDDAVFTDADGYLSEGPTWNLGFVDGDRVVWPDAEVLPGVTMRLLRQVHDRTELAPVNLRDLVRMEAAFATNVTFGVRPIARINATEFPRDHPIIGNLRKQYEEIPPESL